MKKGKFDIHDWCSGYRLPYVDVVLLVLNYSMKIDTVDLKLPYFPKAVRVIANEYKYLFNT